MSTKKRMPLWAKILLAVVIILLLLVLGVYLVLHHYISKMNYNGDSSIVLQTTLSGEDIQGDSDGEKDTYPADIWDDEETVEGTNSPDEEIDEADKELESLAAQAISSSKDVLNILLIGVDRRDASWYGNSDSMILVSINKKSKKIVMTSLMRDTYVTIPNVKNYKLNHAMAVGGPNLLLETVRQNFKVDVNYYMSVDFVAFKSVIDIFGTVPITLNDAEINWYGAQLNNIQHDGNVYYLNSDMALAYARNRSVGRWDYERTERQRKVLLSLINQARSASLTQLSQMANSVLPYFSHNIPETEMLFLLAKVPTYLGYDMIPDRIPYDGLYQSMTIEGQGMLVPDWGNTVNRLYNTIYN